MLSVGLVCHWALQRHQQLVRVAAAVKPQPPAHRTQSAAPPCLGRGQPGLQLGQRPRQPAQQRAAAGAQQRPLCLGDRGRQRCCSSISRPGVSAPWPSYSAARLCQKEGCSLCADPGPLCTLAPATSPTASPARPAALAGLPAGSATCAPAPAAAFSRARFLRPPSPLPSLPSPWPCCAAPWCSRPSRCAQESGMFRCCWHRRCC